MYKRFYNEGLLEVYSLGRAPNLKLFLGLFVVFFALCVYLFTGKAAEAQGLVDAAPGAVQETVAAPAAPAPAAPAPAAPAPAASEPVASEPVTQQTAPLEQQAAPVAQPTAGAVGRTAGPVVDPAQSTVDHTVGTLPRNAGTLTGGVKQAAGPVSEPVEQAAWPVVGTVEPVVRPVHQTVAPVVGTVNNTVEYTTEPIKKQIAQPVIRPVRDTVEPVVRPVQETINPVAKPVVESVKEAVDPVIKPVQQTAKPVVKPVEKTTEPDAAAAPDRQTEPPNPPPPHKPDELLLAQTLDLTGAEGGESLTGPVRQAAEPVAAPAELAPVLLQAAVATSETAEGISSSEMGVPSPGSAPTRVGVDSWVLDAAARTATVVRNASSQLPQSSPLSGAPPTPAPAGASGGSSLGGAGPDLGGALALLLIALLGGKFLWYARNFFRPDSVYGLIVNQPG